MSHDQNEQTPKDEGLSIEELMLIAAYRAGVLKDYLEETYLDPAPVLWCPTSRRCVGRWEPCC